MCTWLDAGSLRAVKLLNLFFMFHVPRNKGNTRADANYPYIKLAALIHVEFKTFVQTKKSAPMLLVRKIVAFLVFFKMASPKTPSTQTFHV